MNSDQFKVKIKAGVEISVNALITRANSPFVVIAHGAGNDMHSPFISYLHETIAENGISTIKFNFPYKEQGRKAPDRPATLETTWNKVIDTITARFHIQHERLFVSGKSMGGRYASMVAAEKPSLGGLIVYGYPLHAPGQTDKLRTGHLATIECPMLFFQGTRDSLCRLEYLEPVLNMLPNRPALHLIEGGDHSFKVLKKLARTEQEVWREIAEASTTWINEHT